MTTDYIDVSIKGRWVSVPAVHVNGQTIVVRGSGLKIARIHDEDWSETELQDPEACISCIKTSGIRADILTFAQKPPSTIATYSYPMEPESVAVIRLRTFREWWESLPQESRKNVRRAQKRGVEVRLTNFDDKFVSDVVELNNHSPLRQGRPNTHYGKTFDQVKRDYSSYLDRSDLIGAYAGEEMIGLIKLVYRGETASILQCLPKASQHDKRPANALLAKAVEICEAKGVSCITYGLFRYGNRGNDSLLEFKTRNGFEEVLVPRYFVPLTAWGSACVALKLHRGLVGIVPRRLITMGSKARERWYHLRQQTSRCSSTAERPNRTRQMECSNPPAGSNTQTRPTQA